MGKIRDWFNGSTQPTVQNTPKEKDTALSGQRVDFPNDSNLPQVENWTDRKGFIKLGYTGEDMALPLLIEQSIYESPAHKSCIKLKVSSAIGAGYTFENTDATNTEQRLQIMQFEKTIMKNGLDHCIQNITRDFIMHNRINFKVTKKSKFVQYERTNPSKVGYNMDITKFYFSRNFDTGRIENEFSRYRGQKEGVFMTEYDGNVDKYEPYAVPEWLSVFPNVKINSMIPKFHEANMENSVGISLVFRKPTEFESVEERNKYRGAIQRERGVKGTGNFIVLSGNGMENVAEVTQLQANQNDKLFAELRNSTIDDICMGHNVNPVLIGVKTPGSLGASSEFDIAYKIMYNIEVMPVITHIEKTINDILKSLGFTFKFKLNENKALLGMNAQASQQSFKMEKI